MKTKDNYKNAWDKSYERGENNILYPQLEVVRFLNRYISKRNNDKSITKLISPENSHVIRGLDFACGVGTHCITFSDFNIEGYGVDISSVAIKIAKRNAAKMGFPTDRFQVLNPNEQILPFENNFFDFIIAESCLDSMPRAIAKNYISEFKRVCRGIVYGSFIGRVDNTLDDDFIVNTDHERGTVQTLFNTEKISDLLGVKKDNFSRFELVDIYDKLNKNIISKRYYVVIKSDHLNSSIIL